MTRPRTPPAGHRPQGPRGARTQKARLTIAMNEGEAGFFMPAAGQIEGTRRR